MPDVVDPATRSRMMSGIRGKDTKPEIMIRRGLHARGFRYRLHAKDVSGKPDLVFPRYRAVVFVNGCFWHGHSCHLFKMPGTRTAFWQDKIERNRTRDAKVRAELCSSGWRCLTIWECALKGRTRLDYYQMIERVASWLRSGEPRMEISGKAEGGDA